MSDDQPERVSELIAAAERAEDLHTTIILLRTAKRLAPDQTEVRHRLSEALLEAGDYEALMTELRQDLERDPLDWLSRLLLLTYARTEDSTLRHAGALASDLVWERRYPRAWFNCSQREPRSRSELSYDLTLLSHLGLSGRQGYGVVTLSAVDGNRKGAVAVLNPDEPWIQVFEPSGDLRFGRDLWLEEEGAPVVAPADLALTDEGLLFVADARGGCVRRFRATDGEYLGAFETRGRSALPVGLAEHPTDGCVVVLGADGSIQRYDRFGRAVGRKKHTAAASTDLCGDPETWGIALDTKGEVHVTDGVHVLGLGRRGRKASVLTVPRQVAPHRADLRHGLCWNGERSEWLVARPEEGDVARVRQDGEHLSPLRPPTQGDLPPEPVDVATFGRRGSLVFADRCPSRVHRQDPKDGWSIWFGNPDWTAG